MSLVKDPVMTEKNRAARQRNGQKSRGAVTPEGKERARAANLRHGCYSKVRDEALTALGEDPADLAALIDGAYEQWRPANGFQAKMVEQVAHLQWRIQRAVRMQENVTAEHVKKADADRHEKTMPWRYHYVDMVGFLSTLQQDAARPDFFASPGYIYRLTQVFVEEMKGGVVEILKLLHRLQKPQDYAPASGRLPAHATNNRDWQEKLQILEEQGEGFALPYPELPVAEGAEREGLREELRQIAAQELSATEAAWDPFFEKYMKPMEPAERDKAACDIQRTLDLLRRQEDSCFRQFWRLATLLMKIQDREEKRQQSGARIEGVGAATGPKTAVGPNSVRPEAAPPAGSKNAGASGDVDENKGGEESRQASAPGMAPAAPASPAQGARVPLTDDQTAKRNLESELGRLGNRRS